MKDYELYLIKTVFPLLDQGRPDWDKEHTKVVVSEIKNIINNNEDMDLDRDVLVISAYLHDIGYSALSQKKNLSHQDVRNMKKAHMIEGVRLSKEILPDPVFDFLNEDQKARIIHLVGIHDKLRILKDKDEIVLAEADTLGGLNIDYKHGTFDEESTKKYIAGVRKVRIPLFITDYAKNMVEKYISNRLRDMVD